MPEQRAKAPHVFDPSRVMAATAGDQYVPSSRATVIPELAADSRSALERFVASYPTINGTVAS